MSAKRINLGHRIIGKEARAAQVKYGKTTKQRLGKRILGIVEEPAAAQPPAEGDRTHDTHHGADAGMSVTELRFLISEEGSDLLALESAERERTGGPRKTVLAAIEEEHERRRAAHPEQYAEGAEAEEPDDDKLPETLADAEASAKAAHRAKAAKKRGKKK